MSGCFEHAVAEELVPRRGGVRPERLGGDDKKKNMKQPLLRAKISKILQLHSWGQTVRKSSLQTR